MSEVARWRARYLPGEWVVLSGPTSLVVLQPFGEQWSELVEALWEDVLASASLGEVASRLAGQGLDEMPHFGAFFWSADGMRSLVRGDVSVRDGRTGSLLADGSGVQTWNERGWQDVERVEISMPTEQEGEHLALPLVVGGVRASAITLLAGPGAAVHSPQDNGLLEGDALEGADTQLMASAPAPPVSRPEPLPEPAVQPVARVTLSDGHGYDLATALRIGRAPSPDAPGDDVTLVVVHSPQQDISRNHLEVAAQGGRVVVTDLRSTNGTVLVRPGAGGELLPPGQPVVVPVGAVLELGDGVSVRIEPAGGSNG